MDLCYNGSHQCKQNWHCSIGSIIRIGSESLGLELKFEVDPSVVLRVPPLPVNRTRNRNVINICALRAKYRLSSLHGLGVVILGFTCHPWAILSAVKPQDKAWGTCFSATATFVDWLVIDLHVAVAVPVFVIVRADLEEHLKPGRRPRHLHAKVNGHSHSIPVPDVSLSLNYAWQTVIKDCVSLVACYETNCCNLTHVKPY